MEDKKELLKEYFDSVQDESVKKFMEQCIETIPEYKRNQMPECGYPTHPYDPYF